MRPINTFRKIALITLTCLHSWSSYTVAEETAEPPSVEQNGAPSNAGNILIEMQVVIIPQQIAMPLVKDFLDPKKSTAAYEQVQLLLGNGTAKLIGWPILVTKSGSRGTVEAIQELRYVTEFESGAAALYFEEKDGSYAKIPKEVEVGGIELQAIPATFETRNIGVTLEIEPQAAADGKTIDMTLAPQHVRLKSMNKVTLENEKNKMTVEQPEFETFKVTTNITVKSGEWKLLGVYTTTEPKDYLELFILKAEIQKLE